jgi:homocysteine S-methyltransferase
MGTVLLERHPRVVPPEMLNLQERRSVQRVHEEYIAAGARVIQTNTYGANRHRLVRHRLDEQAYKIAQQGVRAAVGARETAGADLWIAGAIGPTGRALAPWGDLRQEDASASFREVVEAMLASGVDLFVCESFADLDELCAAVAAIRGLCALPIVAQMAFGESGRTERGVTPLAAVPALVQAGADVVGANCAVGPEMTLDALWKMREADAAAGPNGTPLPLSAQPNAGFPQQVDGRLLYQSGPEYFARFAPRAFEAGARLIGGCCGTTPAHIAAMRDALSALDRGGEAARNSSTPVGAEIGQPAAALVRYPQIGGGASSAGGAEDAAPTAATGKTAAAATFADKLGRQFVVSVEIDPPKGMNPKKALEGAQMLHAQGVDVINIADSPMARVRMGCIALAHLMQAEVGIETVIHFTCRDRNLMALQSDLIGAHALGCATSWRSPATGRATPTTPAPPTSSTSSPGAWSASFRG